MISPAKLLTLVVSALLSLGATAPVQNWNVVVNSTPWPGHVFGNPAAKIKLVEYASYTCPHCSEFQIEAEAPLRLMYIRGGKLSLEVRPLLRDPVDATVALLAFCGPKEKFAINHSMFLRSQAKWIQPMVTANQAQRTRWSTGSRAQRARAIAADFHFYEMMATRGYDRTSVDKCLADDALADRMAKATETAVTQGVDHTPTFAIDDQVLLGTSDWQMLEPQLAARM